MRSGYSSRENSGCHNKVQRSSRQPHQRCWTCSDSHRVRRHPASHVAARHGAHCGRRRTGCHRLPRSAPSPPATTPRTALVIIPCLDSHSTLSLQSTSRKEAWPSLPCTMCVASLVTGTGQIARAWCKQQRDCEHQWDHCICPLCSCATWGRHVEFPGMPLQPLHIT